MNEKTGPEWLQEIERRTEKATKEPWKSWDKVEGCPIVHIYLDDQGRRTTAFLAHCNSATLPNSDNSDFIARARTDVPRLLTHIRELRGALADAVRCANTDCAECNARGTDPVARADVLLSREGPPEA